MAVNQLTMKGAVAKWCNSESPPQTAETQMEEGAGRDVPPQFVTRLTKHRTPDMWAKGDLMRNRDED